MNYSQNYSWQEFASKPAKDECVRCSVLGGVGLAARQGMNSRGH